VEIWWRVDFIQMVPISRNQDKKTTLLMVGIEMAIREKGDYVV